MTRLVTYEVGDGLPRAGVLDGGGIVDIGAGTVDGLLNSVTGLPQGIASTDRTPLTDVRLLPPIVDPRNIICMGLNYREHAAEAGLDPAETPTVFAKFSNALAPPDAELEIPGFSAQVDYVPEV